MNKKAPKIPKNTKLTKKNNKTTKKNTENTKNTSNKEYVVDNSKIDLPNNVTHTIDKSNTGIPPKYTPQIAEKIIQQIATDSTKDIDEICLENGIERTTMHKWKLDINEFAQALSRAKESRAESEVEDLTIKLRQLSKTIEENDEMDARDKHVRIQLFHRLMQHTHWVASKHNETYRDTPGIQINIDAGGRRAAAWDRWQEVRAKK